MTTDERSAVLARARRASFRAGCLTGAVFMLLGLLALGIAVRRSPHNFPGPVRSFYGATGSTTIPAGPALTLEQLRAIRGVRPTLQVTLTEADINSYLEKHPEAVGLPSGFSAPRVQFRNGRVHMSVRGKLLVIPVRVTLSMEPRVQNGELALSVVKVDAGGVSLPGELRGIAEQQLSRLLSDRLAAAGLEPESVEVGEGTLTVAARLVPVPEADSSSRSAEGSSR
ncbi:MAG: DUF2993 domain-containing protein [Armatimonadota bacterium]